MVAATGAMVACAALKIATTRVHRLYALHKPARVAGIAVLAVVTATAVMLEMSAYARPLGEPCFAAVRGVPVARAAKSWRAFVD